MAATCTVVVCGAPLASRAVDVARALIEAGWQVRVILTDAALAWTSPEEFDQVGVVATSAQRRPDQPKAPRPDVVAVVPATFNTVGKLAGGIADTLAHSALAETLGDGTPMVAVPMVNNRLWGHPAWQPNTQRLSDAGVIFLDPHTGDEGLFPVQSGTGDAVTEKFDPAWVVHQVEQLAQR